MTAASNPMPAITRNTSSSVPSSIRTRPTSTDRFSPDNAIRVALAVLSSRMARLRASRFPVPAGTKPSAVPDPARICATFRIVPSPPQASTTSAPAANAVLACPIPGSSTLVSSHSGAAQPSSVHTRVMSACTGARSANLLGLTTTAGNRCSSEAGSALSVPDTVSQDTASGQARG